VSIKFMTNRRLLVGGYERRAAERYESRLEHSIKQAQREDVADWFLQHHQPEERMRILSLPDEHWAFENRMNDRPNTSFVGLQRDWTTLERSVPWMPRPSDIPPWSIHSNAARFSVKTANGDVQGFIKGQNKILHVWAGSFLSPDNIGDGRKGNWSLKGKCGRSVRRVTSVWLDFTGNLCSEVYSAFFGCSWFLELDRGRVFPATLSFLACRDGYSSHEDRVASVLLYLQQNQRRRGWRFRFDKFSVHVGSSPFVSIFGAFRWLDPQPLVLSK
jgi:hypothetical protein